MIKGMIMKVYVIRVTNIPSDIRIQAIDVSVVSLPIKRAIL